MSKTYHTTQFAHGSMTASHLDLIDHQQRCVDRHAGLPTTSEMRKAWAETRKQTAERSKNNDALS